LTEIDVPVDRDQLATLAGETDAPPPFGVYSVDGGLIFGVGPSPADDVVFAARAGTTESSTGGEIVVATAITDDTESVVGVLRISESYAEVNARSRQIWMFMFLADLVAVAVAWLIARRLSQRLAAPVIDLAETASAIGEGAVVIDHRPTGIGEIDTLGRTLAEASQRVQHAMARERRFSADVSHQLRTPLAALRIKLDSSSNRMMTSAERDQVSSDLDRLEATVDHLLAFARDAQPTAESTSLTACVSDAALRWQDRLDRAGRLLNVTTDVDVAARASTVAVGQILDVLIDNALGHGSGTIAIRTRRIGGGGAIDVSDDGAIDLSSDRLFERGVGSNHGIGLDLARSIAEAEGGRLLVTSRDPSTFSLILLDGVEPSDSAVAP
jgi:signal transduction histidine kinase